MPKSNTQKLSDTQLVILSSAAQREDGLAILPETLKGGAAKAAVTRLLGSGFLKEVRVKRGAPAWRTDEEEKPLGLKLTKAGSAALGLAEDGASEEEAAPQPKTRRKAKKHAPSRGSGHSRAAPRLQAGTDHRADATQERREPHRHGRRDRMAAAHHARGPDRPASEGVRDRARQEPARQDGLPPTGSGARLDQASP